MENKIQKQYSSYIHTQTHIWYVIVYRCLCLCVYRVKFLHFMFIILDISRICSELFVSCLNLLWNCTKAWKQGNKLVRKLLSYSQSQELVQLAFLASHWLFTLVQPIESQLACWHNSWQWLRLIVFHPWALLLQFSIAISS